MKSGITIQERLKDLRVERHLKLDELAELTGISKSALSNYETDDFREISHANIMTLAEFYEVSTDYLLCLTENRKHPNTKLSELHLNDEMIELLKSGRINNRLLCEIATHKNFTALMTDTEIYVDGIAAMHFQDINIVLEAVRQEVLSRYQPLEEDTALKALQVAQISEENYFCQTTHRAWDSILHDIRDTHKGDKESASDGSSSLNIIRNVQKVLNMPGSYLDIFCAIMCMQIQISYLKLSEQERASFRNIMKKSPLYKESPLSRKKRR